MGRWAEWVTWGLFLALAARLFLLRGGDKGARAAVRAGARLVDVRSPAEYAAGHLEGAVNIPVGELAARLAEVGPKEAPVVVYCASGVRSARAKGLLLRAGFREVRNLGSISNG